MLLDMAAELRKETFTVFSRDSSAERERDMWPAALASDLIWPSLPTPLRAVLTPFILDFIGCS